jgi:hypothetical protein
VECAEEFVFLRAATFKLVERFVARRHVGYLHELIHALSLIHHPLLLVFKEKLADVQTLPKVLLNLGFPVFDLLVFLFDPLFMIDENLALQDNAIGLERHLVDAL